MEYTEHVENYDTLNELHSDINTILKRFREVGNLDVEISIDLTDLSITVFSPKESNDS